MIFGRVSVQLVLERLESEIESIPAHRRETVVLLPSSPLQNSLRAYNTVPTDHQT